MNSQVFGRITTNRHTLLRYMQEFNTRKIPNESFTAPRPLPGRQQSRYYGILVVTLDSGNYSFFMKVKGFQIITQEQYNAEINSIKDCWTV
jgi:hypothetical protein